MKTVFTFLIFICLYFLGLAQNKVEKIENGFSIDLNFTEEKFTDTKNNFLTIRNYFEFTDASNSGKFKLPSRTILVAIPKDVKPHFYLSDKIEQFYNNVIPGIQPRAKTLNDSTIIYEEIAYSDIKNQGTQLPDFEITGYTWYHENYCAVIKINTYRFDEQTNQISRIKSAKLNVEIGSNINYEPDQNNISNHVNADQIVANSVIAEQFAYTQPLLLQDTTGNWIDYSSEYLKIGVSKDALFRITKSDLESKGITTASINPRSFRLIESGIEIPIVVSGQDDNVFDPGDYIEFYGTQNYSKISYRIINSPDKPYNEYLNRYSDTTFYFLTWGLQDGKRIPVQNVLNSGVTDSLTYYKNIEHIESNRLYQNCYTDEVENQTPGWLRNKTWYFLQTVWLYSNTIRNYNFNVTDVYPGKTAKLYYKAVSFGSSIINNAHQLTLSLNSTKIDSQSINRNEQVLLNGVINSNQFVANPNILSVKNYPNSGTSNTVVPDWYDIEYPRYLKLNSNLLLFTVPDDITSGLKIVKILNATSGDYEIYKVKPYIKKIESYQLVSNQLLFTDTINVGDQYIINIPGNISNPVYYYKKQFVNLRSITAQTDYLAITHPKFIAAANNYLSNIAALFGVSKDLVSVEDIFDEFGYGYPQPEAIRLFADVNYTNRQNPKPQYLTLIGDANYDYKLYRFKADGVLGGGNYVPSFGNPVSDNWYVVWDEGSVPLPQMKVGRIPINTPGELDYYLSKVQNNFNQKYDEWNKRYILFSGGRADYPDEIAQLKSVNDQIILNQIHPAPLSGEAVHFYKTTNPLSDFGPYTADFISNTIDAGGVFISYLGHSGTATWDNSISETVQLKNTINRNPLITDFGCSTNKFGEPDIVSFGERFLLNNDGQAIGYIGNSSLGFTTTSLTIPVYFYDIILKSITKEIGNAHLSAKDSMFSKIGTSGVYSIFALTNSLIGDPILRIKIPLKPNLKISNSDLLFNEESINDTKDSIHLSIVLNNFGTKDTSIYSYSVQHSFNGNIIQSFSGRRGLPGFKDTISVWLYVKDLSGEHSMTINLDTNQEVPEIYEDDNLLTSSFYVYSTALRDLVKNKFENSALDKIRILNPSFMDNENFNIKYQISETEDFNTFQDYIVQADSFYTDIDLPELGSNRRYWFRYNIDQSSSINSESKSFINNAGQDFYISDSTAFNSSKLNKLVYNQSNLKITDEIDNISVTSAGFEAGATCVISKNGINLLSNTFFAGMGIVVFDDVSLQVDTSAWYQLFNQPANMTQLVNLINSIPQNKIVAMGVSNDAANNITTALKDAIKTLGSTKIDSLTFRGSWALIGKKGISAGNVIEKVKGRYNGLIYIDSTFVIPNFSGDLTTSEIGPSSDWQNFIVSQNTPAGTSINHYLYGIKSDDSIDSLGLVSVTNNQADLSSINPKIYPKIKIKSELHASSEGVSPELSGLGVDYTGLPELGLNYQVVSINKDTFIVGDNLSLKFWVYNTGEADADSFNISVNLVAPLNVRITLLDTTISKLSFNHKSFFDINYIIQDFISEGDVIISVDKENKIAEYYEDNNFFNIPINIISDVTPPAIKITFDDAEVVNGDYVSGKPNIKIHLTDNSPVPITDPSLVKVYLNLEQVPSQDLIDSTFSEDKDIFYKPNLEDGSYLLTVIAKDNSNNADSSEVYFEVSSATKLLQVYNYPNPFSDETEFTFRLSQIPDEVRIKIFTVSGRLIKELAVKSSQLNYDLNKIHWDGKDEDGDIIANGTYFYKVIMKNNDKVESVTQKLVILK